MSRRKPHDSAPEDELPLRPSKTQRKQAMHALQDLGALVLELPEHSLAAIEMAENLREALQEYHRIKSFEARRRQLQYIGKLLRNADPEPLQRAVDAQQQSRQRAAQSLKDAERWRDRLLAEDGALTEWLSAHPGGDTRALRALIREARRELEQAQAAEPEPGALQRKGPRYRELYQLLRGVLDDESREIQDDDSAAA